MNNSVSLDAVRSVVDDYMRGVLTSRREKAKDIGSSYELFWKNIEQVTMSGGKRFRPYLTVLSYGAIDSLITPIAASQEFIHCAVLIHDDIIDKDFVRRGEKNVSGLYRDRYGEFLDSASATHYAIGTSILAGDALLSEAYHLLYSSEFDEHTKSRLAHQLFTSIYEVIGGELIDVEAAFVRDISFDPMTIYRYKTAGYSFISPLLAGAYCANADDQTLESLRRYALNAGIAFQIQDDLLGVYGDERTTGKSTLTDLREAKRTILILSHEKHMDDAAANRFEAFGKPDTTDEQLLAIKQDIVNSGAKQLVTELAEEYFDRAKQELAAMPPSPRLQALEEFTLWLQGRAY